MFRKLWLCAIICAATTALAVAQQPQGLTGKTITYYVAADEVEWDYAPSGLDHMTGKQPEHIAKRFVERGPTRIGKVYRKAIYREYTDETFTKLKPRAAEWEHAGILGPILRAEVGDTIKVIFRNNATKPYTMHPHGVFYLKDSEGAGYEDGTTGPNKADDAVPPKGTHTYTWKVPERAGPGKSDPSSVVWLYHSHRDEPKDVESGLVGAMIITRRGMAGPSGRPKDVDREFVTLFMTFDENQSWYLDHNIEAYAGDPKRVNKLELVPKDMEGAFFFLGEGFVTANLKFTINGFIFGNMPMMEMKTAERVRWYVISLGAFNMHTPHWHGNVVHFDGKNADVIPILPAEMRVVDMVPDNPGTWMFHCHISDHLVAGMHAHFRVLP